MLLALLQHSKITGSIFVSTFILYFVIIKWFLVTSERE